ncbi:pentatricopeptide repeat-containing protein [Tanacetum coccineum]
MEEIPAYSYKQIIDTGHEHRAVLADSHDARMSTDNHLADSQAVKLLREMKDKSLYTSTALVTGLIQSGHFVSAFHLFIEMRKEGIKIIDPFVLSSVIVGSANLAALELGKELHCLVSKLGFECEPYISNALVDMYAKCSSNGVKPNDYACSHVGLVDKCRDLFKSMVECYGLKPSLPTIIKNTFDEAVWASFKCSVSDFRKTQWKLRVADRLMGLGVKDPSRKESEVFHAGETSHSLKDEMSVLLKDLDEEMRRRGYVPDVSFVLRDIGEKDKENQLFWHSERLAVAYGLIKVFLDRLFVL